MRRNILFLLIFFFLSCDNKKESKSFKLTIEQFNYAEKIGGYLQYEISNHVLNIYLKAGIVFKDMDTTRWLKYTDSSISEKTIRLAEMDLSKLDDRYHNPQIMFNSGDQMYINWKRDTTEKEISIHHLYNLGIDSIIQEVNKIVPEKYRIDYNENLNHDYCGGYVDPEKIGIEKYKGREETELFTTYLGDLIIDNKKYHVLKQFKTLQMALVKKGYSKIIFLDWRKGTKKIYNLAMPDQLPNAVINNTLVFKFKNKNYYKAIDSLRDMLCLPNHEGCYSIEY